MKTTQVIFHQYIGGMGSDEEIEIVVDVEYEHDWKIPDIPEQGLRGRGITFEESVRHGVENSFKGIQPNTSTRFSGQFLRIAEDKVRQNADINTRLYYGSHYPFIPRGMARKVGLHLRPRVPAFPNFRITRVTVREPVAA